jgi:hypothetical protein
MTGTPEYPAAPAALIFTITGKAAYPSVTRPATSDLSTKSLKVLSQLQQIRLLTKLRQTFHTAAG